MQAYIATTFFGLENVLAKELSQLGAKNIKPLKRAVRFEADPLQLYKANMGLRTALHILHPLAEEKVRNADQLYALGKAINWMRWFNNEATYAIRARVSQAPEFKSPLFAALKLKDAIADQFRDFTAAAPILTEIIPISKSTCIFLEIAVAFLLIVAALRSTAGATAEGDMPPP